MSSIFENHKKLKFKLDLKKRHILLLGAGVKSQTKSWKSLEKKISKFCVETNKTTNNLTKGALADTKFCQANSIFSSSLVTVGINKNSPLKKISEIEYSTFVLLAVKIKDKLYPKSWVTEVNTLSYSKLTNKATLMLNNALKCSSKTKYLLKKLRCLKS